MARPKDWNLILQEAHDTYTRVIDQVDSSTTYIGKASKGSLTSSPVWQIFKISVSGTVTTIAYAGADDSFSQVWDNRAALSYS